MESNRVKNITRKFEVLNNRNSLYSENLKCKAPKEPTKNDVFSDKTKVKDRAKNENSEPHTVDNKGNIKRTPAFRRDKFIKSNNISNVPGFCNETRSVVDKRIRQFNNESIFSSSTYAKTSTENSTNDVRCIGLKEKDENNGQDNFTNTEKNFGAAHCEVTDLTKKSAVSNDLSLMYAQVTKSEKNQINNNKRLAQRGYCTKNVNSWKDKLNENKTENTNLVLTDTLKRALHSPLPKGVPPKKPPRIFANKDDTIERPEKGSILNDKVDDEINKMKQRLINPRQAFTRSKTESEIKLRKIESALLKHEKAMFSPQMTRKRPIEVKNIKNECRRVKNDNERYNHTGTSSCFSTLLCVTAENNDDSVPHLNKSNFFLEIPKFKEGNKISNNNIKPEEHIYSRVDNYKNKSIDQPSGQIIKKPDSLYYMSTPIDLISHTLEDELSLTENVPPTVLKLHVDDEAGQKIQMWMNEAYGKVWCKSSECSSDSDSVASTSDDLSIAHKVPDEIEEKLTSERKGHVKRVASCVTSRRYDFQSIYCDYHLFECVILVGLDLDASRSKVPYIKRKYPINAIVPEGIEHFCFPDSPYWPLKLQPGQEEEPYCIALTVQNGQRKYGYCLRVRPEGASISLPLAYCLISQHKSNHFYYMILTELESRHGQTDEDFTNFLMKLYNTKFPPLGQCIKLPSSVVKLRNDNSCDDPMEIVKRPIDVRQENFELAKSLSFLRISVFLQIFSSLLLERKIILCSGSISKLSACMDGLQLALLPFCWQHALITIVPSAVLSVTDLCQAPVPYIIGILKPSSTKEDILPPFNTLQEVIVVDIDQSKILHRVGDENSILPYRLLKGLKNALQLVNSPEIISNNIIACEAFTRLFVELVGHYGRFISTSSDNIRKKNFQKETFVRSAVHRSVRSFLEWFSETAMFSAFIESHLISTEPGGLFEERCNEFSEEMDKIKLTKNNVNTINKTVRKIGDRLKDWTIS